MTELSVRPALRSDIKEIMDVIAAAKAIMRASGNLCQWTGGYPSEEVIINDIDKGWGRVVLSPDSSIGGYFCFMPSPEPTYAEIFGGKWEDDSSGYHVIHRIGSRAEVHGVFETIIRYSTAEDPHIRIDTHRDNLIMQHNILKHGFRYCGIIYLASGDERLAYEWTQRKGRIR